MAGKFISLRNLKFLLYEVFDAESLTAHPYFCQHNRKSFDLVLDAAMSLAGRMLHPLFEEMDRKPPTFIDGRVKVHPKVAGIIKEFGRGGWIGATFPESSEGQQLPFLVVHACSLIFSAANYSASVYPGLTTGAARLIHSFGDDRLKQIYLRQMLSGRWQGTMALTEPQAGSSLADIATAAHGTDRGYFLIRGQKVFISAGDHDGAENIVHLMLARIEGAPAGVKGISLFVVPKKRLDESGRLVANDVTVSQIFHKLGYRGAPITELSLGDKGDCRGWLVGPANQGLACMFQMMNEERVGVGLGAAAIASASYHAALDYCRNRLQGRKIMDRNPAAVQVPIIEHADVKRMLLFQKAVVEGSMGLLLQCCRYQDRCEAVSEIEAARYKLLLDLLTPVAKSYPSEMGMLSVSAGLQCLGGYGYCEDFPVEQHFRDMRIHAIHEGTTGIQAMDLLGRKVVMQQGRAYALFGEEVRTAIEKAETAGQPEIRAMAARLDAALTRLDAVSAYLVALAGKKGAEVFLADATLYLELFGIVAIAWQWLLQAVAAARGLAGAAGQAQQAFYQGKLFAARYFFAYELPKIEGLSRRLMDNDPLTVEMPARDFTD